MSRFLSACGPVQDQVATIRKPLRSLEHELFNDLSAATALTPPPYAVAALIEVFGQQIKWRDDPEIDDVTNGLAASGGHTQPAGTSFWYDLNLAGFKMMESVAGATARVTYYGE